jgi:DNA-binding PadR family transcriptional regulator
MSDTREQLGEREPDPWLLALVSLGDGPKQADAMIDEIENLVGVRLSQDTLRATIDRLARRGFIERFLTEDRRRPYKVADRGAEVARAELVRLADMMGTRKFAGCKTLPIPVPGEQLQDPCRGSYEGDPIHRVSTA